MAIAMEILDLCPNILQMALFVFLLRFFHYFITFMFLISASSCGSDEVVSLKQISFTEFCTYMLVLIVVID